jgi:hypothetical protein
VRGRAPPAAGSGQDLPRELGFGAAQAGLPSLMHPHAVAQFAALAEGEAARLRSNLWPRGLHVGAARRAASSSPSRS